MLPCSFRISRCDTSGFHTLLGYSDELSFFVKEQQSLHYQVEIRKHYSKDGQGETIARCLVVFE